MAAKEVWEHEATKHEAAKVEISRMAQMSRFPRGEVPAIRELVEAIKTAPTLEIARAIVTEILSEANGDTACPMPAEIRRAVLARLESKRPDPECLTCGGEGFVFVQRGEVSGATNCSCWARRPEPQYVKTKLPKELRAQLKEARSVTRG